MIPAWLLPRTCPRCTTGRVFWQQAKYGLEGSCINCGHEQRPGQTPQERKYNEMPTSHDRRWQ